MSSGILNVVNSQRVLKHKYNFAIAIAMNNSIEGKIIRGNYEIEHFKSSY
jgi:hypothetical protein